MTVPVIKNLLHQHPQIEVTVVSTAFHAPLFANIHRLHFFAADLKGRHKGIAGMFRLYRELKSQRPIDAVADLHHVLRTRILQFYFILSGIKWVSQDKGRIEKKELTRTNQKVLRPLKSTFQRYADVFAALGFPTSLNTQIGIVERGPAPAALEKVKASGKKLIGVAPFAQYDRKTYPEEKMKEVLRLLSLQPQVNVYLLGGKSDVPKLQDWAGEINNVQVVAGTMNFATELQFIAHLDVVVSMDSANMHLASLYGVPVVSIWGATHPYAGFYGWGQAPENAMQIELDCRPCSVFGNKPGPRPDLACMHGIDPFSVYNQILKVAGV